MSKDRCVNRDQVCFMLTECKVHLEQMIKEIEEGEYDYESEVALSYLFAYVLNHLCAAWHSKYMSTEDFRSLNQDKKNILDTYIPNWNDEFQLVETEYCVMDNSGGVSGNDGQDKNDPNEPEQSEE